MRRARKWFALLLLPLWPLAMLHCDLEAAGIDWPLLMHHDAVDDHAAEHGTSSAVAHPSEDVSLQGASAGLKVPCPTQGWISDFHTVCLNAPLAEMNSPPPRPPDIEQRLKTWRFEQRAAQPARAPDVCV